MATGDNAYLQNGAVIGVDWVGFLCLAFTSFYLFYKLTRFTGPDRDDAYYMGYREDKMLSIFVNLFAAMAYWARICSHANGDVGPAAQVVTYKYLDYVLTCPLLTLDLLWALNLPYKFTYAGFVLCCIISAFMCSTLDGNARYMWFGFGISLFAFTWSSIIRIVKIRLDQFVSKEAKQVRTYLKIACMTYFGIWCAYPTLWMLREIGVISDVVSAILHTVFDVLAKSLYGFALLSFVLKGEKSTLIFVPLTKVPGKGDEVEDEESVDDEAAHDPHVVGYNGHAHHHNRRPSQGTIIGAKPRRSSTRNNSMTDLSHGESSNQLWQKLAHMHDSHGHSKISHLHDNPQAYPSHGSPNDYPALDGSPRRGFGFPANNSDLGSMNSHNAAPPVLPNPSIPPISNGEYHREDSQNVDVNRVQHQIRAVEQELANIMSQNRHSRRAV